jgi:DNA-binding NarL/FixJ family response regulator
MKQLSFGNDPAFDMPEAEVEATKALEEWDDVVRVIGRESASRLSMAKPGVRVSVPMHISPAHELSIIIGEEKARKLANLKGGKCINVLNQARINYLTYRNRAIVTMTEDDLSVAEICQAWMISERTVRDVIINPKHSLCKEI